MASDEYFQEICADFVKSCDAAKEYFQENPELKAQVEEITAKFNENFMQQRAQITKEVDDEFCSDEGWPPRYYPMQEIAKELQKKFDIMVQTVDKSGFKELANSELESIL